MIMHRDSFILQNTRLQQPPSIPEVHLYLADDIMPLWRTTEEILGGRDVPPPFWAFAWVGGQAIARYLLDHPAEVAGKWVVDFATGSGLCAIAAMKAGAIHVLAADIDRFSEAAVTLNARANQVRIAFTNRDLLDADPPDADLILAGDICYEEPMSTRAVAWLRVAHARGSRVLFGDPDRAYFPREGFLRLAEYDVPTTRDLEGVSVKRAGVFTFP
jgi:predicted nicotinamide N-methyase